MMKPVVVSKTQDYFLRNGKPFFYLADTVWSSFTNTSFEEWEEYLNYRKMQGFNVLQIDILPQWDRSQSDHDTLEPFHTTADGRWDFYTPHEAYFKKAKQMVAMASDQGFIPALVVLWCNYVEGTWGAQKTPGTQMPLDAVHSYVEYVCQTFGDYQPIFLVSGDTDLKTSETIEIYLSALRKVKECCPNALTTFHLNPSTDLPEEVVNAPGLNFYMYQSGHHAEEQSNAYTLAQRFCSKPVKRPVVNGEPCYEGHGFGNAYGRFSALHVRRAVWQSLLSGAKAGFTYGAHGIWSWHEQGQAFPSAAFSSLPYSWRTALQLQGAWDAGYIKWMFETYELFDIEPCQENVLNDTAEIRMAASPGDHKVAIYLPFNTEVRLKKDLSAYNCLSFNLSERFVMRPDIEKTEGGSLIHLHQCNSDILIIGRK